MSGLVAGAVLAVILTACMTALGWWAMLRYLARHAWVCRAPACDLMVRTRDVRLRDQIARDHEEDHVHGYA